MFGDGVWSDMVSLKKDNKRKSGRAHPIINRIGKGHFS